MATRREFLQRSALATAGVVLSRSAIARSLQSKPRVIVLGAGLAGLAAAYSLSKENYDVVVLEARNRIGGRVLSHEIDKEKNLTIELGGEWIGKSHQRMIALVKECGLELFNNQFNTHLIYKDAYSPAGTWSYEPQWKVTFNELLAKFNAMAEEEKKILDKTDWWRYLMNAGITERDLDLRELADSTDFGESIRTVSAYSAITEYAESSEKNEMDLKIRGGNAKLPLALAGKIGADRVLLGRKVVTVQQEGTGVTVLCADGSTYSGKHLICALPTFAMSRIQWSPGLPEDKKWAIDALQYCRINKHALLFKDRFWGKEDFDLLTDSNAHYFYHGTKSQPSRQGVLISYSIGDKADVLARQNNAYRRRIIAEALRPGFGDVSGKITRQVNYYWGNDEYSMGAYAMYGKDQWFSLQPVLARPFDRIYFAGEHIADWQGFMEGAVVTGEDAAKAVMAS